MTDSPHAPDGAEPALRWPLIGRAGVVERVVSLLLEPAGSHVSIVGDSGVGKSSLARAVVEAAAGRAHGLALSTLPGGASVPYGALANLLVDMPAVEADGSLAVTRAVATRLDAERGELPCIVWVDDAHEVDEPSAAVLSRLALARKVRLLLTSRPSTDLPPSLAAILRSGAIERVDLAPLDDSEVAELLHAALGAPPTLGATRQIVRASDGNPLYVRELIRDALRQGNLVQHGGLWAWRGPDAVAGLHLREMVAAQLATLPASQREALELVALAEPLAVPALLGLVQPGDLDALEREHLVSVEGQAPPTVRLAHPIYGEAVRALVPTGRRVELRRRMLAVIDLGGDDSLLTLMRSVAWSLDCGIEVEPERLVRAADAANQSHDYGFAARAAQAALGSRLDHRARLALAFALRFSGRVAEAHQVLEATASTDPDELVEQLLARATLLQYGLDRVDDALASVDVARGLARTEAQARAIDSRRFVHAVYGGVAWPHVEAAERMFADPSLPAALRAEMAPSIALVRALAGRSDDAMALLGQYLRRVPAAAARVPWEAEEVYYMTVAISLVRGSLPSAHETAASELEASDPTVRFDPGAQQLSTGWFLLNCGRAEAAGAQFSAAIASFVVNDPSGFEAIAVALAAEAAAVAGQRDRALQYAATQPRVPKRLSRLLSGEMERAMLWPSALGRGVGAAIADAHTLATRLRAEGDLLTAAHVLHDAVRLGDGAAAPALFEVAAHGDSPRVVACGMHGDGLVRRDGKRLSAAAEQFELAGMRLHAAEAWTDAATAFRDAGRADSARRAAASATVALNGLGPVRTPRLMRRAAAQPLTRREVEITELASRHLSNAEIAEVLGVGRRTVEGHLHRAYTKLGVSNRDDLSSILG